VDGLAFDRLAGPIEQQDQNITAHNNP